MEVETERPEVGTVIQLFLLEPKSSYIIRHSSLAEEKILHPLEYLV